MNQVVKKKSLMDLVPLDDDGMFKPKSLQEQMHCAEMLLKSGMFPSFDTPKAGAPALLQVIQACLQLHLPIAMATGFFYYVKGKVTLYGDGPLLIVQRKSNTIEWIDEFYIDKNSLRICLANKNIGSKVFGAVCLFKKHGDEKVSETYFTLDDAATAGLIGGFIWKSYYRLMMKYKARTEGLKNKFPEYMQGLEIAEYTHNALPGQGIIEDQSNGPVIIEDQADDIVKRFDSLPTVDTDKNGTAYVPCPEPSTCNSKVVEPKHTIVEPGTTSAMPAINTSFDNLQQPTMDTPVVISEPEKVPTKNEQLLADNSARIANAVNNNQQTEPIIDPVAASFSNVPPVIEPSPEPASQEIPGPVANAMEQVANTFPNVSNVNVIPYGKYIGNSLDNIPRGELVSYFNSLCEEHPQPEGEIFELMTQINKYLTTPQT